MSASDRTRPRSRLLGVLRGLGFLAQSWMLDELLFGLAILGLVDILVATDGDDAIEATIAVIIGVSAIAVPLLAYFRRWSDQTKWTLMLPLAAASFAVLALSVHS